MSGMLISLCSSCHGIWKFVGWGTICYGCDTSSKLMELYLPIWRQKECVDAYWTKSKYSIVDSQLCAGFKDGKKDSCQVLCSFPQINRLIELSKWIGRFRRAADDGRWWWTMDSGWYSFIRISLRSTEFPRSVHSRSSLCGLGQVESTHVNLKIYK